MTEKYNGYTNYETWLCNLWHDELFYSMIEEWVEGRDREWYGTQAEIVRHCAEIIEQFIDDEIHEAHKESSSFLTDLTKMAAQEINFIEIATLHVEAIEDYNTSISNYGK